MTTPLILHQLCKSFTMHLRDSVQIPVVDNVDFHLSAGECAVLGGPSGIGKSSILKMIYGNYGANSGQILVCHEGKMLDLVSAEPRQVLDVRTKTIGYVSQFLRAIPRVSAIDVVAEPLVNAGMDGASAVDKAQRMLQRLNLPDTLWQLPPATFSGGEQQRVNIARGFITNHPILLLDEPTASLDAKNRQVVIDMIHEKKAGGVALLGIFHDGDVRESVADKVIDVMQFATQKKVA